MILTVEIQFTLTSAGDLMRDIRAGLWQTLERKSAMSGKPFPAGSNVVMVTYLSDGEQLSGAVHLEELPESVRKNVEDGATWME